MRYKEFLIEQPISKIGTGGMGQRIRTGLIDPITGAVVKLFNNPELYVQGWKDYQAKKKKKDVKAVKKLEKKLKAGAEAMSDEQRLKTKIAIDKLKQKIKPKGPIEKDTIAFGSDNIQYTWAGGMWVDKNNNPAPKDQQKSLTSQYK